MLLKSVQAPRYVRIFATHKIVRGITRTKAFLLFGLEDHFSSIDNCEACFEKTIRSCGIKVIYTPVQTCAQCELETKIYTFLAMASGKPITEMPLKIFL